MTELDATTAASHPEEMRSTLTVRVGNHTVLHATARATPAGLIALGALVPAILLSTAVLVRAARGRPLLNRHRPDRL